MLRAILEIRTAKDSLETPEATIQFLSGIKNVLKTSLLKRLFHTQPTITLEIASLNQSVHFVVTVDKEYEALVKSQIAAQYPTAVITNMEDYLTPWSQYGAHSAGQLLLAGPSYLPLKIYTDYKTTDPLSTVLGVLGKTNPGSAIILQIVLAAAPKSWSSGARRVITKGISIDPLVFKAHPQQAMIEMKLAASAYQTSIRLLTIAPDKATADQLLLQASSSFGSFALADTNSFKLVKSRNLPTFIQSMISRDAKVMPRWQFLNLNELATLFHFPGFNNSGLRNIAWGKTVRGEAPDKLPVEEGATEEEKKLITFFAKTEYKNRMMNYGIRMEDRRRHFYILGKSGTGKSTLIAKMAIADMENGRGMAIIDPHGDLCEILLDHVPTNRLDDIIYLDPSEVAYPFHLNPLEVTKPEYKELTVSNILSIFTKIWANVWSARMEYILRNALATLVELPGSTMLDIPNLLTDDKFRDNLLKQINPEHNRVILDFWYREYNQYNDKFRNEAIAPILNKVGQFIAGPTIRRILQQPTSTINIEDIMNSGKILLLNLSQGKIGEDNAALLGAMFITQFQQAAMNRIHILEDNRRDFFLYVDEFQNFATESFIKILSEARKYHLDLILANQYTAQLEETIQKAIFGNIGTMVSFVVGADDATRIMAEFGTLYTQDDLVNLGKYQIINKISIDNRISNPFPAYTLPVPKDTTPNRQIVLERSHQKFERQEASFSDVTKLQQLHGNMETAPMPKPNSGFGGQKPQYGGGGNNRNPSSAPTRSDAGRAVGGPRDMRGPVEPRIDTRPNPAPTQGVSIRPDVQRSDPKRSEAGPRSGGSDLKVSGSREITPYDHTHLEKVRLTGFRPTVVGCLLKDKQVLLVHHKQHAFWQLPQGGIDNHETLESAFSSKMSQELGASVPAPLKFTYLGDDQIEFPPEKANQNFKTDSGKEIKMKGKHYFFIADDASNLELKPSSREYDQIKWFTYTKALEVVKETNRGGKLRLSQTVLERLKTKGLIA